MKEITSLATALFTCIAALSYADPSSNPICQKGIFPNDTSGSEQAVMPSITDEEDNGDTDTLPPPEPDSIQNAVPEADSTEPAPSKKSNSSRKKKGST